MNTLKNKTQNSVLTWVKLKMAGLLCILGSLISKKYRDFFVLVIFYPM